VPGPAQDRILVIKLGALGDVVQALGPMAAVRTHHPDAHVTVLTTAPFADFLTAARVADQIRIDDRPGRFNIAGWLSLRRRLRDGGYRRVYDLQTSDRSSAYFRLFWPGPDPEWSGFAAGCSHPHANPNRDLMHTVERQMEQLRIAGIETVPAPSLDKISADVSRFALPARFAVLVPGGATHRPEKRWPIDHYRALAEALAGQGIAPVTIGQASELALCEAAIVDIGAARNLAGGTSLIDLVELFRRAEVAIGNDTGPMHIAAAAGTRSVVLYSAASDPALCAQRGLAVTVLRRPNLADLSVSEVQAAVTRTGSP